MLRRLLLAATVSLFWLANSAPQLFAADQVVPARASTERAITERAVSERAVSERAVSERERRMFISTLVKNKFFRDATCIEFTSSILEKVGLPKLGSGEGIQTGVRWNVSRQQELVERPIIEDGVQLPTVPKMLYEISTHELPNQANGAAKGWALELTRTREASPRNPLLGAAVVSKTRFVFGLRDRNNKVSCELTDLYFGIGPKNQSDQMAMLPVPFNTCLDSFILYPQNAQDFIPSHKKESLAWLREDCATSLRYSLAAKNILKKASEPK